MSYFDEEYFCPNCDAILNEQTGFDPDAGVWTCTECGVALFGDDVAKTQSQFEGVVWYCDSCGAVLSMQDGFYDSCGSWECTECGEINSITNDEIYELQNDYDDDDDDDGDDDDDDENENNIDDTQEDAEWGNSPCEVVYPNNSNKTQHLPILKKFWYHLIRKKFEPGVPSYECTGENFKEVVSWFLNSGFRQVYTVPIEELTMKEIEHEGLVKSVSINGCTSFDANSMFPFNSKIIVSYYALGKATPPFASSRAKGKNYMDVIAAFHSAGFCYIETRVIYDLVFGWLKKDGSVEQISINDCTKYETSTFFRLDAKIIIAYHTFRKYKT